MIKIYFYLIIFLFLLDCSLNPNSKFWTKEKKILVDKSSTITLVKGKKQTLNEFNQNFKITLPKNLEVNTNQQLNNDGFKFFIPLSDFESLKNNQVEQLNYKVDALKVNIEKEYACLHPASEQNMNNSNSKFFPRPNKENY